jgi:hypothetical protein
MKKKYQLSFQKIRRKIQIKDISYFEIYLKNIFSDLAKRDLDNNEKKGIEKITFINYMNLPFIVGEKLLNVIDKNQNGFLSETEFISGIINLYVGSLEETQKTIFKMLDFDLDGKIIPEDSRLLIFFIKNLAKPPENVMKVKPCEALTEEENLEEINLLIKNFFNNKSEMSFEEYKYNIENVNSDVYFLFICFLYNNKPFNDNSIKILKLLNKNTNLVSSASSKYISCSSDACRNDANNKIRRPSQAFKSFISDLVDLDLDEIQRDCAENSGSDPLDDIDEGVDNNLLNEGYESVSLPMLKPILNLNQLKANKDYLIDTEFNKRIMPTSRIRKTYDNYMERVAVNDCEEDMVNNAFLAKEFDNQSKIKAKLSERKKYLNEEDFIVENSIINEVKKPFLNSVSLHNIDVEKPENSNSAANLFQICNKRKIGKSQTIQQGVLNSIKNISLNGIAENFPKIEIYDRNFEQQQNQINSNMISFTKPSSNENFTPYFKKMTIPDSNVLDPNNYEGLNGNSPNNHSFNSNEEIFITESIYENYIFKSRNNNKLKKYYMALIGTDLFYFSNSKMKKLRGMHNVTGTYIYEDENVINVNQEKENANDSTSEKTTSIFYAFKLYFRKKPRIYYCPSESEAKNWIKHIRNVTKFRLINDYYDFGEELGSGKFGKVKLGYEKISKKTVAIKAIEKAKLKGTEFEMVKTEIEIMKFCKHKNIVRLIDHFEDMENIYIVLEYLPGGNLNFFLSKQQKLLSEERIKGLILQLARGIAYLHNFGIVHRDLKPENTMMSDLSDDAHVKIVDFGLSKILGINEKSNEAYGTLSYAAPEVIQKNDYNNKIDIWSLGVVMYFMICGYLPFYDKNNDLDKIAAEVIKKPVMFKMNVWGMISNESKDLVMKCLERDIDLRLNILEFMEHVWFKK